MAMATILVNTIAGVANAVAFLPTRPNLPPSIFVHVQPTPSSSSIATLAIHIHPENATYLFDIASLGRHVFTTPCSNGTTLRTVLESESIIKVIFALSELSHALFVNFSVRAAGMLDLQLMELGLRTGLGGPVHDLATCVQSSTALTRRDVDRWLIAAADLDSGLDSSMTDLSSGYAARTAATLPPLWYGYAQDMSQDLLDRVQEDSSALAIEAQSLDFQAHDASATNSSTMPNLTAPPPSVTRPVGLGLVIPQRRGGPPPRLIQSGDLTLFGNGSGARPSFDGTEEDTRQSSFPDDLSDGASYSEPDSELRF